MGNTNEPTQGGLLWNGVPARGGLLWYRGLNLPEKSGRGGTGWRYVYANPEEGRIEIRFRADTIKDAHKKAKHALATRECFGLGYNGDHHTEVIPLADAERQGKPIEYQCFLVPADSETANRKVAGLIVMERVPEKRTHAR
jgi:hypothetical protein